jgi:hypothetical protein
MGMSLAEATGLLLLGKKLAWGKYKDHKAGSITLDKPEQRRLLEFLLSADSSQVASGDDALFDGLVAAWENTGHDPAKSKAESDGKVSTQSWRLDRVEAFNFGGLTIFGGKAFDLYVGGSNWCLEGQNGSGKTSLVSAILWALTGKRIREHEGPIDERGERESVENDDGTKIGNWPPLAAYPTTVIDLVKQAEVWVRLTFKTANGDTAIAFRRMISPPIGAVQFEEQIDDRLNAARRLTEIGILMPARLAKIGFGKNSLTLYESVKQLTGLDQLSFIAEGCSAFGAAMRAHFLERATFLRRSSYWQERGKRYRQLQFGHAHQRGACREHIVAARDSVVKRTRLGDLDKLSKESIFTDQLNNPVRLEFSASVSTNSTQITSPFQVVQLPRSF